MMRSEVSACGKEQLSLITEADKSCWVFNSDEPIEKFCTDPDNLVDMRSFTRLFLKEQKCNLP